jgi:hypothetical protein
MAGTSYLMGGAMGQAMLELLKSKQETEPSVRQPMHVAAARQHKIHRTSKTKEKYETENHGTETIRQSGLYRVRVRPGALVHFGVLGQDPTARSRYAANQSGKNSR